MYNPYGMYFVSFATIRWIDVFVREIYLKVMVDSLNYCIQKKGMWLFAYCIMPSQFHMVFQDMNAEPSKLLKELKTFTSKKLRKSIQGNKRESRRGWILEMSRKA